MYLIERNALQGMKDHCDISGPPHFMGRAFCCGQYQAMAVAAITINSEAAPASTA